MFAPPANASGSETLRMSKRDQLWQIMSKILPGILDDNYDPASSRRTSTPNAERTSVRALAQKAISHTVAVPPKLEARREPIFSSTSMTANGVAGISVSVSEVESKPLATKEVLRLAWAGVRVRNQGATLVDEIVVYDAFRVIVPKDVAPPEDLVKWDALGTGIKSPYLTKIVAPLRSVGDSDEYVAVVARSSSSHIEASDAAITKVIRPTTTGAKNALADLPPEQKILTDMDIKGSAFVREDKGSTLGFKLEYDLSWKKERVVVPVGISSNNCGPIVGPRRPGLWANNGNCDEARPRSYTRDKAPSGNLGKAPSGRWWCDPDWTDCCAEGTDYNDCRWQRPDTRSAFPNTFQAYVSRGCEDHNWVPIEHNNGRTNATFTIPVGSSDVFCFTVETGNAVKVSGDWFIGTSSIIAFQVPMFPPGPPKDFKVTRDPAKQAMKLEWKRSLLSIFQQRYKEDKDDPTTYVLTQDGVKINRPTESGELETIFDSPLTDFAELYPDIHGEKHKFTKTEAFDYYYTEDGEPNLAPGLEVVYSVSGSNALGLGDPAFAKSPAAPIPTPGAPKGLIGAFYPTWTTVGLPPDQLRIGIADTNPTVDLNKYHYLIHKIFLVTIGADGAETSAPRPYFAQEFPPPPESSTTATEGIALVGDFRRKGNPIIVEANSRLETEFGELSQGSARASTTVTMPPVRPEITRVTALSADTISVLWDSNTTSGQEEFIVYFAANGQMYQLDRSLPASDYVDARPVTVGGLEANTRYCFVVGAVDNENNIDIPDIALEGLPTPGTGDVECATTLEEVPVEPYEGTDIFVDNENGSDDNPHLDRGSSDKPFKTIETGYNFARFRRTEKDDNRPLSLIVKEGTGTYTAAIHVGIRNITIQPQVPGSINVLPKQSGDPVFVIDAEAVNLSNFQLGGQVQVANGSSNFDVTGNVIDGGNIDVEGASNGNITGNTIKNAPTIEGAALNGIHLAESSHITVERNVITNSAGSGIKGFNTNDLLIKANVITKNLGTSVVLETDRVPVGLNQILHNHLQHLGDPSQGAIHLVFGASAPVGGAVVTAKWNNIETGPEQIAVAVDAVNLVLGGFENIDGTRNAHLPFQDAVILTEDSSGHLDFEFKDDIEVETDPTQILPLWHVEALGLGPLLIAQGIKPLDRLVNILAPDIPPQQITEVRSNWQTPDGVALPANIYHIAFKRVFHNELEERIDEPTYEVYALQIPFSDLVSPEEEQTDLPKTDFILNEHNPLASEPILTIDPEAPPPEVVFSEDTISFEDIYNNEPNIMRMYFIVGRSKSDSIISVAARSAATAGGSDKPSSKFVKAAARSAAPPNGSDKPSSWLSGPKLVPKAQRFIHHSVGLADAWEIEKGQPTPIIALFDTGIHKKHVGLLGPNGENRLAGCRNFVPDGSAADDCQDRDGHGTKVAGVILASESQSGGVGVTWGGRILALRVDDGIVPLDVQGEHYGNVLSSLLTPSDPKVRIVNASTGIWQLDPTNPDEVVVGLYDTAFEGASATTPHNDVIGPRIAQITQAGKVFVTPVGNGFEKRGVYGIASPAAMAETLAVFGLQTFEFDLAHITSHRFQNAPSKEYLIAAPAQHVTWLLAKENTRIAPVEGTSFAAPVVSGVLHLVFSHYGDIPAYLAIDTLLDSAVDVLQGDPDKFTGFDGWAGFGRINAGQALGRFRTLSGDLQVFDHFSVTAGDGSPLNVYRPGQPIDVAIRAETKDDTLIEKFARCSVEFPNSDIREEDPKWGDDPYKPYLPDGNYGHTGEFAKGLRKEKIILNPDSKAGVTEDTFVLRFAVTRNEFTLKQANTGSVWNVNGESGHDGEFSGDGSEKYPYKTLEGALRAIAKYRQSDDQQTILVTPIDGHVYGPLKAPDGVELSALNNVVINSSVSGKEWKLSKSIPATFAGLGIQVKGVRVLERDQGGDPKPNKLSPKNATRVAADEFSILFSDAVFINGIRVLVGSVKLTNVYVGPRANAIEGNVSVENLLPNDPQAPLQLTNLSANVIDDENGTQAVALSWDIPTKLENGADIVDESQVRYRIYVAQADPPPPHQNGLDLAEHWREVEFDASTLQINTEENRVTVLAGHTVPPSNIAKTAAKTPAKQSAVAPASDLSYQYVVTAELTYPSLPSKAVAVTLQNQLLCLPFLWEQASHKIGDKVSDDSYNYGFGVAASGNVTAVLSRTGGPHRLDIVDIYRKTTQGWVVEHSLPFERDAMFIQSIAVSQAKDNVTGMDLVVVGEIPSTPTSPEAIVYVYAKNTESSTGGEGWSLLQPITPAIEPTQRDQFGRSIAVDGDTIVIGTPNKLGPAGTASDHQTGAISFFEWKEGQWIQTPNEPVYAMDHSSFTNFGQSVAISGTTVLVGAPLRRENGCHSSGRTLDYVAENDGIYEVRIDCSLRQSCSGNARWSVHDQNQLVDSGLTFFQITDIPYTDEDLAIFPIRMRAGQTLAVDTCTGAVFGASSSQILGLYFNDQLVREQNPQDQVGGVYVYKRTSGGWSHMQTLAAPEPSHRDYFGGSIAISGNIAAVGAPRTWDDKIGTGAVYLYQQNDSGQWSFLQRVAASDGLPQDRFGYDVAIDANNLVVGATGTDDPVHAISGTNYTGSLSRSAGSVYMFQRNQEGLFGFEQRFDGAYGGVVLGHAVAVVSDTVAVDSVNSVADGGSTAVVGAPYECPGAEDGHCHGASNYDTGSVTFYQLDGNVCTP